MKKMLLESIFTSVDIILRYIQSLSALHEDISHSSVWLWGRFWVGFWAFFVCWLVTFAENTFCAGKRSPGTGCFLGRPGRLAPITWPSAPTICAPTIPARRFLLPMIFQSPSGSRGRSSGVIYLPGSCVLFAIVLALAASFTGRTGSQALCFRAQLPHRPSFLPVQIRVLCSPAQLPHFGLAGYVFAMWPYFWQLKHCTIRKPDLKISVALRSYFQISPLAIALSACSACAIHKMIEPDVFPICLCFFNQVARCIFIPCMYSSFSLRNSFRCSTFSGWNECGMSCNSTR